MAGDYSYLTGLSSSELEKRAKQNSADWHTDAGQRSNYEAENKAIKAELDKRNGTTSTLDTTTGKWTTTGGTSGSTTAKTATSGGMTSSETLALGKGPLSSTAAANYAATGSTTPTTASAVIANSSSSPKNIQVVSQSRQETTPVLREAIPAQQQGQNDLAEYLRQQKATEVESALAGLKGAYEQSMAGYKAAKDQLPKTYEAHRNSAAAQDAIARRTFQERAAAQGLSSGAAGQAELARSSALTGTLAQIDQAQAGAEADIDLQIANLESQYQQAIQQAKASGDSQLATALYQELIRAKGLERQDEQLAYNRAQSEDAIRYNREQAEKAAAQERVNTYLAALGQASGLDSALVDQSGYTPAEISALEQYYANQSATGAKPALTAAQVSGAIKAGNLTPNVLSAYEYYYGIPYSAPDVSSGMSATGSVSTGTTPTAGAPEDATLLNRSGNGWIEIGGSRISTEGLDKRVAVGEIVEEYDAKTNTVRYVFA